MMTSSIYSRPVVFLFFVAGAAYAQNTTPIDVTVDTGSHTCTSIGQDHKVYKAIEAGAGRYFYNDSLEEVSRFGSGNCVYTTDGGEPGVVMGSFKFTDADGAVEVQKKIIKVTVRAYADCTNDPIKLNTRIGTECRFTATSKKGNQ